MSRLTEGLAGKRAPRMPGEQPRFQARSVRNGRQLVKNFTPGPQVGE